MADVLTSIPIGSITPNTEDNEPKAAKPSMTSLKKDEILFEAFTMGWQIIELKSRVQIALIEPKHFCLRLVSIWRALFNKIAGLHVKIFPDSATTKTLYEPPSRKDLPYLYPPEFDYANIGIPDKDNSGTCILKNFKLYEITRRAINCLTILYIDKKESLIPDAIEQYQKHLVQAVLAAAKNPGAGGGTLPSDEGTLQMDCQEENLGTQTTPELEKDKQKAIAILTERTVKFLAAWDGFLRENFYTGGRIPGDDDELIAYEAGRAMSLLSWGVTMKTVPLEIAAKQINASSPQSLGEPLNITKELIEAWKFVFRDEAIIRLQHQISALSSTLDDTYYEKHPETKRQDENNVLIEPDPDQPCHILNAVKQSIDYWHRSVKLITKIKTDNESDQMDKADLAGWSKAMRLALIEQANVWQTLMTGQQSLRAYKMESITNKLMSDLTDEMQKSLGSQFKVSITQAEQVIKDMSEDVKQAISMAGNVAKTGLDVMYLSFKRFFWPMLIVGCCVFLVILGLLITPIRELIMKISGVVGLGGISTAILNYFNMNKTKKEQENKINEEQQSMQTRATQQASDRIKTAQNTTGKEEGFLARLEGAASETGKEIFAAFRRAYEQIRIELTGLKFSAAVSYPLIEFFILNGDLKSDEEFLTQVIWCGRDRNEEIRRVVSAAFGPLSIFMTPYLGSGMNNSSNNEMNKQA